MGVYEFIEQQSDHGSVGRDRICAGDGYRLTNSKVYIPTTFEPHDIGINDWPSAELVGYWVYRKFRRWLLGHPAPFAIYSLDITNIAVYSRPINQQTFGF